MPEKPTLELIDYRVEQLEQMMKKIVENQEILTRIELSNSHLSASIADLKERQAYQGKIMDTWAIELEAIKTKTKSTETLKYMLLGAIVVALVTGIFAVI